MGLEPGLGAGHVFFAHPGVAGAGELVGAAGESYEFHLFTQALQDGDVLSAPGDGQRTSDSRCGDNTGVGTFNETMNDNAEQVTRKLFPLLGYGGLEMEFDLSVIEALGEDENARVTRESQMLDRGVLTINEVRRARSLPDVPWGNDPPSRLRQGQPT